MATEADKHHLKNHGYVVFQLLSPQEAQIAKQHIQNLESQRSIEQHEETVQLRISELIPAGSPFNFMAKLVCHPALLDILHHYLGPKCRCATFSSNTLLPQDGTRASGLGWHVDYPYHDIEPPWAPPEFPLGCQVLICLDEFTKDNGGTMFMPDSHKHKPEGIEADEEGTLDGTTVLEAPAGSVLIAHSAWWHRQTKNTSGHSRTALLGNYTPGYVVPKDNMEKQWRLFRASAGYDALSRQEQEALEELLLGADKRGLYEEPLPY